MKNVTKILLALIALFVLGGIIISCDQDTTVDATMLNIANTSPSENTSDDTPDALGKIVIYYQGDDKRISAWDMLSTDYSVPTGNVQESDFRAIEALMEGKVIRGLSFEGIKRIEGRFQSEDAGWQESPLTQLRFSSDLQYIGENVFRTSIWLCEVEFLGATPVVEATAFPGGSDYEEDCLFSVPSGSGVASWVEVLKPFISTDYGRLNIVSYLRLDANVTTYLDRYPISFGNPVFSNGETELEGPIYAGRSINNIDIPHDDSGDFYFTFMGFYAEKDNPVTQVIDAIGESIPNVAGYTDSDGAWIREEATTVLYAHWEELLP